MLLLQSDPNDKKNKTQYCEVNTFARTGPIWPFRKSLRAALGAPQGCAQPSPPRPKKEGTAESPTSRAQQASCI